MIATEMRTIVCPDALVPASISRLIPDLKQGSISRLIPDLKRGEQAAIEGLWLRYFPLMIRVATRKMVPQFRRAVAADEVVTDAFLEFCAYVRRPEKCPRLHNRESLRRLLTTIVARRAMKRPTGWRPGVKLTDEMPSPEPWFATGVAELLEILKLKDETLYLVAVLRLQGFKNVQIAAQLNRAVATVELKLKRARSILKPYLELS